MWRLTFTPKTSFVCFAIVGLGLGAFMKPDWRFMVLAAVVVGLTGAFGSWLVLDRSKRMKPLYWPRLAYLALAIPTLTVSGGMLLLYVAFLCTDGHDNMAVATIMIIILAGTIAMLMVGFLGIVLDLAGCFHVTSSKRERSQ